MGPVQPQCRAGAQSHGPVDPRRRFRPGGHGSWRYRSADGRTHLPIILVPAAACCGAYPDGAGDRVTAVECPDLRFLAVGMHAGTGAMDWLARLRAPALVRPRAGPHHTEEETMFAC